MFYILKLLNVYAPASLRSLRAVCMYRVLSVVYYVLSAWYSIHTLKQMCARCRNRTRRTLAYSVYCAFHVLVQTNFRRYYFYFLPDQAQIFLDHFIVFRRTLRGNFNWTRQHKNNFPKDPHCKNCPLFVAEAGNFYNEGLWGNSLPVVWFEQKVAPELV